MRMAGNVDPTRLRRSGGYRFNSGFLVERDMRILTHELSLDREVISFF